EAPSALPSANAPSPRPTAAPVLMPPRCQPPPCQPPPCQPPPCHPPPPRHCAFAVPGTTLIATAPTRATAAAIVRQVFPNLIIFGSTGFNRYRCKRPSGSLCFVIEFGC